MRRAIGVGMGLMLALSGCAVHQDRVAHLGALLHDRPIVTVKGGLLSVAPEPVVFSLSDFRKREPGQRVLVWELPQGYAFAPRGIEFKGAVPVSRPGAGQAGVLGSTDAKLDPVGDTFRCRAVEHNPRAYSCAVEVDKLRARQAYRYMIRVRTDKGESIEWDPHAIPIE